MKNLKAIIESLLLVAATPLAVDRIQALLPEADSREIRAALQSLAAEYSQRNGGFVIREVAGGYQFRTQPQYREVIKRMLQPNPVRLSRAALETLAIIAYKQPIIRHEIEQIRGVDSGGILRMLLDRRLVRVLGRREIPGRPLIYATTKQFLELFDLKDLRDLPSPKEIEELGHPPLPTEAEGPS
jgi:segregation and condensation protein B